MERRVREEGKVVAGNILLVDDFLNHQIDMRLMDQIGDAFAAHFAGKGITRVTTIESSGIAPAAMTALKMGLPLVVFKKGKSRITNGTVYQTNVQSFTKNQQYELTVLRRYLPAGERVLFIDDFLAMGEAAIGMAKLIAAAGSELAGVGIVIEKTFQLGRRRLDAFGYDVFSLARIERMEPGEITFVRS